MKPLFTKVLTFQGLVAVALMFWCAGAGCMIVSYARAAMMDMNSSASAAEQPMASMTASMDAHACCKAKHKSAKRMRAATTQALDSSRLEFTNFKLPPMGSNAMSCCPLTSGSIAIASRSQINDGASVEAHAASSSFESANPHNTPLAIPLRLPNRAHSYLLDCAFLI